MAVTAQIAHIDSIPSQYDNIGNTDMEITMPISSLVLNSRCRNEKTLVQAAKA
jgi:hypothetical protein